MARYLLGESAAAWLRGQMGRRAPDVTDGRTRLTRLGRAEADEYPHPYELQYAADSGAVDENTGVPDGAWIVYLPPECLVVDGEAVSLTSGMTAAAGYPSGWYDLTDIFDGTDPDTFDVYLDASAAAPQFVITKSDATNPILVAKVANRVVKPVVKSAVITNSRRFGGGFAWDPATRTIGAGYVIVGFAPRSVQPYGPISSSNYGEYTVEVKFAADGTDTVSIQRGSSPESGTGGSGSAAYTYIRLPLYSFDQNWNVTDKRCGFCVPAWS